MSSIIDLHSTILVYGDTDTATSNPLRRYSDWSRHTTGIVVNRPLVRGYVAQPGETLSIFSGTRTLLTDGTSAFSIALNPAKTGTYRITNTAGTVPAFRTVRAYNPSGVLHTLVVNNNSTLEMTCGVGVFTGAVVGDIVFIPGVATGDAASPFNPNNTGFWQIIGIASAGAKLILTRRVGETFNAAAEAVTPTLAAQLVIFSSSGVQIGDNVEISSGFSVVTQKSFVVSEVTDKWFEFVSTSNLPLETGILPGASGITIYTDSKRFVRVECDQEAVVRLNGDAGNTNRLTPRVAGDPESVAHFEKWGPVWQLQVVNRSTVSSMVVTVISVE